MLISDAILKAYKIAFGYFTLKTAFSIPDDAAKIAGCL